jgi:uncharacterized RDD family membrane protein YckC
VHGDQHVVTGEAVAVELQLAGAGSRGIAAMVDIGLVLLAQLLVLALVLAIGPGSNDATISTVVIVAEVLIVLGYPVITETLTRGRTLGKAMMGLRAVRDDGGPIRFRHAFVRGLVGVVLDKPGITLALAAFIPMLIDPRHKRLGDHAAGTLVLQVRVPAQPNLDVQMPPALAGWASTLDLSGVDDGLALAIRQYLSRASALTPQARAGVEAGLIGALAGRIPAPPPGAPAWAVLTAVLAERRRRAAYPRPTAPVAPAYLPPAVPPAVPPDPPSGSGEPGFAPPR